MFLNVLINQLYSATGPYTLSLPGFYSACFKTFIQASTDFFCEGPGGKYIWFMDIWSLLQPLGFVTAVGEQSWAAWEQVSAAVTWQRVIDKNKL